jgi:hypothetical protein
MDIHCVLHALCSEGRPTVLNVAELLLMSGTVWLVLRDIHDLAVVVIVVVVVEVVVVVVVLVVVVVVVVEVIVVVVE